MSKRMLIGVLLTLSAAAAADETAIDRVLRLGDSHWELYRPAACKQRIYDLGYLTDGLRSVKPGLGLRFRPSHALTVDLRFDPITDRNDVVGPVYDSHLGAAMLTFAIDF